jgi:hypothetical protein
METQPLPHVVPESRKVNEQVGALKTFTACISGAFVPGLGHALLRKWDRAIVFFGCIATMIAFGIGMHGRLFNPEFGDFFATLKFIADAGSGLLYWIPWLQGSGTGDPTAYTYDFANVFIYVAGLLNMLIVVDVFDIALGRKQ